MFLAKRGGTVAQQLAALAESRRAKFQNTIYHLEPNIKDAPGGLRDLQTTRWLLQIEPQEGHSLAGRGARRFWAACASGCMSLPGATRTF